MAFHNPAMPLSEKQQQTSLDRPARLRGLALLALMLLMLLILGGTIWRNLDRLDTIHAYVGYSHRIQNVGLDLQKALMDELTGGQTLEPARQERISEKIGTLANEEAHLLTDTPLRLQQVILALAGNGREPPAQAALLDALGLMHQILDSETDQRETMLEEINRDTLAELELATGTLISLLVLAWIFLRRRILAPLHDLRQLLLNLAKEDYAPIATQDLDPLLLPVFNSYNVMVRHLTELEEAKRRHAQSLEAEVRAATQALLEQQRSLARAERLALVGELAASLAHELRNPLAGIQMSCANLRSEIRDADQAERLDLIGAELKRMSRLLNELLEQGRQVPLPATDFRLRTLVQELFALTRYQIPSLITLSFDVPYELSCHLPEPGLRQALLNLVLNAAQALDESPGDIRLTAHQTNDVVYIEICDSGPGFSDDMLASGIRPFGTGRARGIGLGLAMVQRFAREAGGQIQLSNKAPHGACVQLTLPTRNPA